MSEKDLKKGTTTIGLVCKDGIVMATEMRATMGKLRKSARAATEKLGSNPYSLSFLYCIGKAKSRPSLNVH